MTLPDLAVNLPAIGTSRTSTGYWNIKGRSSDLAQFNADKSDLDLFIFRYAEVLLNYAEAKYELTGSLTIAELDKSINLIRDRVGMPHLTTNPDADPNAVNYGYTVAPLLYEIRRERRIELVGEGFRFNDIIRWKAGKLIEGVKTIRGMKLTDELRSQYADPSSLNNIAVDDDYYILVYQASPLPGNGMINRICTRFRPTRKTGVITMQNPGLELVFNSSFATPLFHIRDSW